MKALNGSREEGKKLKIFQKTLLLIYGTGEANKSSLAMHFSKAFKNSLKNMLGGLKTQPGL